MMDDTFRAVVAAKTYTLLRNERAILTPKGTVFWVKPAGDRLLVIFDPAQVDQDRVDNKFAHKLSTLLQGRRVVRSNHRGLFLQVGLNIPPVIELASQPLDLVKQPTPWSLPVGSTASGDLWLSLVKDDSFLVGGARDMGKSYLLHGFIQALLHGGQTEIYAWDGKDDAEYLRYYGQPHFHLISCNQLQAGLEEVRRLVTERMRTLTKSGAPNVKLYNDAHPDRIILPIALIIDEAAEVEDQATLVKLVKVYRAAGVHPVLATNDPVAASVVCKSNLTTRISLAVVSHNDSSTILARTGAEKLPKIKGRGLVVQDGQLVQFQGYTITYPQPSQAALEWLASQVEELTQEAGADETRRADAQAQLDARMSAEALIDARVLELIAQGEGDPAIVRQVWNITGGSRYYTLRDRVQALRASSSSEKTSPPAPISAQKGPFLPEEEVTTPEEGEA